MDENGKIGNFQTSLPGNGIPSYLVQCSTCNHKIGASVVNMIRHEAECGGKKIAEDIEKLAKLYNKKLITSDTLLIEIEKLYKMKLNEFSLLLELIADHISIYSGI